MASLPFSKDDSKRNQNGYNTRCIRGDAASPLEDSDDGNSNNDKQLDYYNVSNHSSSTSNSHRSRQDDTDDKKLQQPPARLNREESRYQRAIMKSSRAITADALGGSSNHHLDSLDRDIQAKLEIRHGRSMPSSLMSDASGKKKPAANDDHHKNKLTTAILLENKNSKNKNNSSSTAKNVRFREGPAMIPGVYEERNNELSPHKQEAVGGGRREKVCHLEANVPSKRNIAARPRFISLDDDNDDFVDGDSPKGKKTAGGGQDNKKMDHHDNSGTGARVRFFGDDGTLSEHGGGDPNQMEFGSMGIAMDNIGRFFNYDDDDDDELAVARVVIEEETDDEFIPVGVEFDPDAKNPQSIKRRRCRYLGCSMFLVLVLGVGASVIFPTHVAVTSQVDLDDVPTLAPTSYRSSLGIQEQIEKMVGKSKLREPGSPHNKALEWILHEDSHQLTTKSENLTQRYILALLYFLTSQEGPWRSCNPPTGNETAECVNNFIQTADPSLTFGQEVAVRWVSDRPECEWVGVVCDELNRTMSIQLSGQQLSGRFPGEELGHLTNLRYINFAYNRLAGPLPDAFRSNINRILNLDLQANLLSGTIPEDIFKWKTLDRINLGNNRLSGPLKIPLDAHPDRIQGIFLYENALTGPVPTEIGMFANLGFLRLHKTQLSGSLPSEIGKLTDLHEMWLHRTGVSGRIPSEIGNMESLQRLNLQFTAVSGELPDEIFDLPTITRLNIFHANLSGTISTKIGQLEALEILRLRGNHLEGTIPTEMNRLTRVRQVWLHHNNFTGDMPEGLCQLRDDSILLELVADCALPATNTPRAAVSGVQCPCCTQCCDRDSGFCS